VIDNLISGSSIEVKLKMINLTIIYSRKYRKKKNTKKIKRRERERNRERDIRRIKMKMKIFSIPKNIVGTYI
jgi:hypothetical protein